MMVNNYNNKKMIKKIFINMDINDVYDEFVNACVDPINPSNALKKTLKRLKKSGVTQKQITYCCKKGEER